MMIQNQKINLYFPLSLSVGLVIVLAIFYTSIVSDWRFFDDDYGAVFVATNVQKFSDTKNFFTTNHNDKTIMPTNILRLQKDTFSTTSFRPLTLFYYYFVTKIFDPKNPQHYFLLSVFLHVFVTLLLFFAFRNYLLDKLAFLAALLFGVFPFSGKFLGRFVIQPYSLVLLLNLLSYFLIIRAQSKNSYLLKVGGALIWGASLLFHEAALSFAAMYFVLCLADRLKCENTFRNMILDIFPFGLVMFGYFLGKYLAYPNFDAQLAAVSFLHKLKFRLFDFVTIVFDVLGYSFIPGGNRLLKIGLFFIDFVIFTKLFLVTGLNLCILSLLGLFVIQSWPSILIMHVSRYLYFSLPFFILAIFLAYQKLLSKDHWTKSSFYLNKLLISRLVVVLGFGLFAIRKDLKYLENKFIFTDNAIKKFSHELVTASNNDNLCFVCLPFDYFPVSGLAQAIWFYSGASDRKIFYDVLHSVRFDVIDQLPDHNFYTMNLGISKRTNNIIKLKINFSSKFGAHVLVANPFGFPVRYSMGKISFKLYKDHLNRAKNVDIAFSQKFSPFTLVFWDYKNKKFKKLSGPQR